ncbi:MAG TPA: redoxin domain-containing protein [Thermoanaerobaculia bacterium]|nr:redoxin domain-containing protein [Thermoanaerobaculia bacterium]
MLFPLLVALLFLPVQERVELEFPAHIENVAPAFSLYDLDARLRHTSEFEGHAAIAIVFLNADDATARRRELKRLACASRKRDVELLVVDVTESIPTPRLRAQYRPLALGIPILFDENHTVARRYLIEKTPTVCLLDRKNVIRYIGAMGAPLDKAVKQLTSVDR